MGHLLYGSYHLQSTRGLGSIRHTHRHTHLYRKLGFGMMVGRSAVADGTSPMLGVMCAGRRTEGGFTIEERAMLEVTGRAALSLQTAPKE